MEILQLRYFIDAAATQNFSKTAKKFYVPPSAVSQSIKRLEKELGVALFTRHANKIKLSENGMFFEEKIKTALSLIDQAKTSLRQRSTEKKINLSIYTNRRIIMQTVEKFSQLYPDTEIVAKYLLSPDTEQVDLVISDAPFWNLDMPREELLSEDILLALHKDDPLSKKDLITPEELACKPFICTNKNSSLYSITQKICEDMGFSPRIVIHSDDPYYIRKCIDLGLGISLVPSVSWRGQFSDQVVLKKIGNHKRTTYVYKNSSIFASEHIENFLALLHHECDRELSLTNA